MFEIQVIIYLSSMTNDIEWMKMQGQIMINYNSYQDYNTHSNNEKLLSIISLAIREVKDITIEDGWQKHIMAETLNKMNV